MNEKRAIQKPEEPQNAENAADKPKPGEKMAWETPKMEDVSEEVMAQPYIRFT